MIRFLFRRFLWFGVTVFCVIAVSFFLMRSVRGGPFDGERTINPTIQANIEARYHLDWPLWMQFIGYVGPINLDQNGPRWLSWVGADEERKSWDVIDADGSHVYEGEPQGLPHLHSTAAKSGRAIDELIAVLLTPDPAQAEIAAAQAQLSALSQTASPAAPGDDPVLPRLLGALASLDPDAAEEAPIFARIDASLAQVSGHELGATLESEGQSAGSRRARQWFGWYYENGGDRRWRTGTRPWGGILTGDFGPSFRYRDFTVNDILRDSLPISIKLGILAMAWALALGLTAGLASALRRGSMLDLSMRLFATGGIALPNFVIAGILVIFFVFMIPIFPVAGWGTLKHMILPGFCLGAPFAAYIARLTRTGMLESLSQDHILTARAKGLSPTKVVLRHALKGGILPVVSYLGPATAGILTGSLVIERLFFIPGTGSHFINSATNRDYTLAMGVTILYTVLVYGLNTIVDLAYTFLDPRIDLEGE